MFHQAAFQTAVKKPRGMLAQQIVKNHVTLTAVFPLRCKKDMGLTAALQSCHKTTWA